MILEDCPQTTFYVVEPAADAWTEGTPWAFEAKPGDWVRRRGWRDREIEKLRAKLQPDGMVVANITVDDNHRILILWFR